MIEGTCWPRNHLTRLCAAELTLLGTAARYSRKYFDSPVYFESQNILSLWAARLLVNFFILLQSNWLEEDIQAWTFKGKVSLQVKSMRHNPGVSAVSRVTCPEVWSIDQYLHTKLFDCWLLKFEMLEPALIKTWWNHLIACTAPAPRLDSPEQNGVSCSVKYCLVRCLDRTVGAASW